MEIKGNPKTIKGTEKTEKTYFCKWCQYKFKQYVCKSGKQGNGKRGDVSDKVKCPKCNNFLKTWNV